MENEKIEKCCVVVCDSPIDANFWDSQYKSNQTAWDLGMVSPPIKSYIDSLEDKNIKILIPGAGNAYEAEYLIDKGFSSVTIIEIAPTIVDRLMEKFKEVSGVNIVLGDFFEHKGKYDLILEQTFFCALAPDLRLKYVWKMHQLLTVNGVLAGLLFNREFEEGPPFGGTKEEYINLFNYGFDMLKIDVSKNSIKPRENSELFIEFKKNNSIYVQLYSFTGITCSGCKETIIDKFYKIENTLNVMISNDFSYVLVVSKKKIPIQELRKKIAYDSKYSISIF
jgi:methyl halide transferase